MYPLADYDPRWEIAPDSQNQFATLWIRHPGFGWSGFGFPRHEAGNIAKWLRRVTTITATQEAQSPSATTFGRDEFLLTTEGLGFYYYGRGETRIGPNPFEQMEFDSDRAAAIVAGSIVEQRLEQALRSRMKANKPKETGDIFRSSGPLGSFSSKIAISYLLGMLSDDAHHDVLILKNVRNDFAHKLDFDHFDLPSSKDRCKRLILVDRHVGPVPDPSEIGKPDAVLLASPYLGLPDFEEKLADPRFRYTMTAQLVSSELGMAADNPHRPLPFV